MQNPILVIVVFRCSLGLLCSSWPRTTILAFADLTCGLRRGGTGGRLFMHSFGSGTMYYGLRNADSTKLVVGITPSRRCRPHGAESLRPTTCPVWCGSSCPSQASEWLRCVVWMNDQHWSGGAWWPGSPSQRRFHRAGDIHVVSTTARWDSVTDDQRPMG